eukprot:scaffold75592_cov75-Cyclotella_meneghiniana.AAC.6
MSQLWSQSISISFFSPISCLEVRSVTLARRCSKNCLTVSLIVVYVTLCSASIFISRDVDVVGSRVLRFRAGPGYIINFQLVLVLWYHDGEMPKGWSALDWSHFDFGGDVGTFLKPYLKIPMHRLSAVYTGEDMRFKRIPKQR